MYCSKAMESKIYTRRFVGAQDLIHRFLFRFVATENLFIWFLLWMFAHIWVCVCVFAFPWVIAFTDNWYSISLSHIFLLFLAQLHPYRVSSRLVAIYRRFQFTNIATSMVSIELFNVPETMWHSGAFDAKMWKSKIHTVRTVEGIESSKWKMNKKNIIIIIISTE